MATILDEIIINKKKEVVIQKALIDENKLIDLIENSEDLPRGFMQTLQEMQLNQQVAVIAEIKKASPSEGVIRENFNPVGIARTYAAHGASCLSVLTDRKYFQGSACYLKEIREAVGLPILRKDFIIYDYQVIESRALGADCILLIVAVLSDEELLRFTRLAHDLGMDVLVEVHDKNEFDRALKLPIRAIGVNNRNLHDFSISLETTLELKQELPADYFLISESGFSKPVDVKRLQEAGIHAFLIGTSFMRADNPGEALEDLIIG